MEGIGEGKKLGTGEIIVEDTLIGDEKVLVEFLIEILDLLDSIPDEEATGGNLGFEVITDLLKL